LSASIREQFFDSYAYRKTATEFLSL